MSKDYNKHMLNIYFNSPRLGMDDSFTFGCSGCGSCCREREDILLSPIDLCRIVRYTGKSAVEILEQYCEVYEGEQSHIPVVRIRPRVYRKTCPFNNKGKCSIHPAKPTSCALFPVGRFMNVQTREYDYILQPIKCGNKRETHTLREWLDSFSLREDEAASLAWSRLMSDLVIKVADMPKLEGENKQLFLNFLLTQTTLNYNPTQDLLPQLERNYQQMFDLIDKAKGGMIDG